MSTVPKSQIYRGFSSAVPGNDWKRYDINAVKQDLINNFHIRQGEKLTDPTFGTIIWDVLYEPLTDQLKRLIIKDVTRIINYDPRVKVEEILVGDVEYGIVVECTLTYLSYNITERLRFDFSKDSEYSTKVR